MKVRPRCIDSADTFPYKAEIVRALENGDRCRKDSRQLLAGELIGTYQIRLNIAKDPKINGGIAEADNYVARDIATIVKNLSVAPETKIAIYYIGPSGGTKYFVFEYEDSGGYVGCLRGRGATNDG